MHRREGFAFLGIPFGGFIDIDDIPLDLVLHTPGGLVLAAEQIASALADHPGRVTVYVPHYAMSGGTLIALAADRIVMAPSAVLRTGSEGSTRNSEKCPRHRFWRRSPRRT